jgi:hypothetical protein
MGCQEGMIWMDERTDAIVLGCVKRKRSGSHPARDLYDSPLWRRRRDYAEESGLPWFIFSAKHGLLVPDQIIENYDRRLEQLPPAGRAAMGQAAAAELERRVGNLAGRTIEVHAGRAYVRALEPAIAARKGVVRTPLAGEALGLQLRWYREHAAAHPRSI